MSNTPDFSNHGYEIIEELGRNREGGRITWKARELKTGKEVVLKQFCFAQAGSDWSAYSAHEREIDVLEGLNHPCIPRYLESFETDNGFCLIQEYKNALSLGQSRSFAPETIKIIAIKVLEILVYLQNQEPPVIHRDIKPENILVDNELNVYLIDFGFSRIGSGEVSGSSVFKGTPGFIAPEQMIKPTKASDLYGLGTTLICLLTGTKSIDVLNLTNKNDHYHFEFKHLVSRKISTRFVQWLEKMVAPNLKDRFSNAKSALNQLKSISVQGLSFSEKLGNGVKNNLTLIWQNKTVLIVVSEKLGNGVKNILTLIWQNKTVLIVVIAGIIGIKVTANIVVQNRLKAEQQKLQAEQEAEQQKLKAEQEAEQQKLKAEQQKLQVQREKTAQSLYITRECAKCDLQNVDFDSAYLEGANLEGANLNGANLEGANLEGANLNGVNLNGVNLERANLNGANLNGVNLEGANLYRANLYRANLYRANLERANFNLTDSYLESTNLKGANLKGANLERANLPLASLQGANLQGANLTGANLTGANLTGANLTGANLTGANLMEAKSLKNINLTNAIMPDGTKFQK